MANSAPALSLVCAIIIIAGASAAADARISLEPPILSSPLQRSIKSGGGGGVAEQLWCVAKNNAEDSALQGALDWACGPGGADCGPIQVGGPCYDPNDLLGMASYAFNDYCLKHGMDDDTCYFNNAAALTSLDPSHDNCKFMSSSVVTGNFSANSTIPSLDPSCADMSTYKLLVSSEVQELIFSFPKPIQRRLNLLNRFSLLR
ncbi:hypothetical protein Dimus_009524 [Dionaea muscipula]